MHDYDVVIIGGGVSGCAVARELSRCKVNVCVFEKEEDVCCGTSKANSGIVHAGYDAPEGSVKARMNLRGNELMETLAEELDIPFERNGSLVLCLRREDMPGLRKLYDRGIANGVKELRILDREEVLEMEPNVTDEVFAALYAPSAGIVCPFELNIALAENACDNGVEFKFLTEVTDIKKLEGGYELAVKGQDPITTRFVVNAAGVYGDVFHNMVCEDKIRIVPRKGDYCLLDREAGKHVDKTIFQLPGKYGKGILVAPTIHGNLLIGPTATDIDDKEGTYTTAAELAEAAKKSAISVKNIPYRQVITSFSGLRAHETNDEFIIGESAEGFFDAAGIESPGLSSAPAIGVYLAEMIARKAGARKKADFIATRKGIPHVAAMSREERAAIIKERPDYGTIVCRCENVSEGEIVDSIRRTLGARSLDGIKRRVRQGMGRCQAGFCTPRTMEILSREAGIPMEEICKNQPGSEMITGEA